MLSAPGTHDRHHSADLHVLKQPFGISDTHADAAMGRGRNAERGEKWNLAGLRDFVWDAVEADVAALATLGESCHPAHALVRVWRVIGLS